MPHFWLPWKSHELSNHPALTLPHSRTLTSSWGRTPPPAFAKSHVRRPWGFLMVSWKGQHGFQELVQPFGWFEATQNLGNLQSGPLESGWYGFSMIFSLFWKTRFSVCFGKWTLGKWMVWIFSLFWKTRLKPSVGSWTRFLRRDITTTRFLRCTCSLDLPQDSEAS